MGFIDVGDLLAKSKKKGHRVVTARFDPSAPSTSVVMLGINVTLGTRTFIVSGCTPQRW